MHAISEPKKKHQQYLKKYFAGTCTFVLTPARAGPCSELPEWRQPQSQRPDFRRRARAERGRRGSPNSIEREGGAVPLYPLVDSSRLDRTPGTTARYSTPPGRADAGRRPWPPAMLRRVVASLACNAAGARVAALWAVATASAHWQLEPSGARSLPVRELCCRPRTRRRRDGPQPGGSGWIAPLAP